MIDVPVFDMQGNKTGSLQIDEAALGGKIRYDLLKQAVVTFNANQRQGSARTKSRGMVAGSTRKLFRQKGTGNARMGTVRTCVRRGGGRAFAKRERDFRRDFPKKMRQLARNSALLAKLQAGSVLVVDPLEMSEPKTKVFHAMLKAVGADRGCLVALDKAAPAILKSGRNIANIDLRPVRELNAYEILRRRKVVFNRSAFEAVLADPETFGARSQAASAN